MIKVAPSILSADFANMQKAVENLKEWGADLVHCDVMDGVYVPNITFGMPMVKALKRRTDMPLDVHLMITEPEKYVGAFCDAGADFVTFHPDASKDDESIKSALIEIKSKGAKSGLVINADIDCSRAMPYLKLVDMILIMTVQAGFGGQSFKAECLNKVKYFADLRQEYGYNFLIEVDGGVCPENINIVKNAGADIVVAGSAVFGASCPKSAVKSMQI